MKVSFSKYHATGNDYVYIDCSLNQITDYSYFTKAISNRHFGIGSDGAVFLLKSTNADVKMRIFNADGSEAEACGNATRCVADYLYRFKGITKNLFTIETKSGIRAVQRTNDGMYIAEMGKPCIIEDNLKQLINIPIIIDDAIYPSTAVNIGNPHCVVMCKPDGINKVGVLIENHPFFPEKTNVEFVDMNDSAISVRVWERGSGETYSCGTGAVAVAFVSTIMGMRDRCEWIEIKMTGGSLYVYIDKAGNAFLKGAVTHVFDGVIEFDEIQ